MKRVLLLRPDQAGDAIKTLPVLRALKRRGGPEFEWDVLCSRANLSIFSEEPGIKVGTSLNQLASHRYDLAINLLVDPSPLSLELLAQSPASQKWSRGPGSSGVNGLTLPDVKAIPESELIARLLRQALHWNERIAWEEESAIPTLSSEDSALDLNTRNKKRKWIAFCPFSSQSNRCFSIEEVRATLEAFADYAVEKIFLMGTDRELGPLVLLPPNVVRCSPPHFRTLTVYFQAADFAIGVDAGPMHLASALRKPLLLFGRGVDVMR